MSEPVRYHSLPQVEPYVYPRCRRLVVYRPYQVCRALEGDGRRRFSDRPIDGAAQRQRDTAEARRLGLPTPEEIEARAAAVRQGWERTAENEATTDERG